MNVASKDFVQATAVDAFLLALCQMSAAPDGNRWTLNSAIHDDLQPVPDVVEAIGGHMRSVIFAIAS